MYHCLYGPFIFYKVEEIEEIDFFWEATKMFAGRCQLLNEKLLHVFYGITQSNTTYLTAAADCSLVELRWKLLQ